MVMMSSPAMTISERVALIRGTGSGPRLSTPDPRSASLTSLIPMNAKMAARPAGR
jgi:hypothetical protein